MWADFYKRIQKFDSNGRFIIQWGKGPYWLVLLMAVLFCSYKVLAVDSNGNVYVADTYDFRIQKFDSNGKFVTKWGKEGGQPGSGDGEFASSR